MSEYIGLQEQIKKNNIRSLFLLVSFPLLILGAFYVIIAVGSKDTIGNFDSQMASTNFLSGLPLVFLIVGIWFLIAYFSHSTMINMATGARYLDRKENLMVYNLTENLCMGIGMTMPKLQIIESDSLNAFASGINQKTYTVTLTRGILNSLDDSELEGVIAHELMHIRNKDVRLLIISIIFVGIFSFLIQFAFRSILYGSMFNNRKNGKDNGAALMIVILLVSLVAYFLGLLFKFALSRKREYMADAGAAQMTKNPLALASALRKISGNADLSEVKSEDIQEMFIENPPGSSAGLLGDIGSFFSTHPPIEKRIQILEQF
jgi:heat shock protein HtpX